MAIYYFRNTGDTNWGTASNWSLTDGGGATGAVPTAADDALFTANSGNCTVNASARVCKTLNFTGYTNTITMTFGITVSGNVTLSATMTIAGASGLTVNATGSLRSNGKTWPNSFNVSGSITCTLLDDWIVSGSVNIGVVGSLACNLTGPFSLYVGGNLTLSGTANIAVTATIVLNGSGTISGNYTITNNIIINTSGTITGSGTINYATGTMTYTAGTVNSLSLSANNPTLNLSGITLTSLSVNGTTTLLSNLTCSGQLTSIGNVTFVGAYNISCGTLLFNGNTLKTLSGNITVSGLASFGGPITTTINGNLFTIICQGGISITATVTGSANIRVTGGTISSTGTLQNPLELAGNVTFSGTFSYNTGTLTYTSGTVTTTGSTLTIGAPTTLNTGGMSWNNVTFSATSTQTLLSDLNILGNFSATSILYNGNFNINIYGSVLVSSYISQNTGRTIFNLLGNGTIAANNIGNDININGNYTIVTLGTFGASIFPIFRYLGGNVKVTAQVVGFDRSILINCDKINFKVIQITAAQTITMNKFFSGSALVPTRIQSTGTNYTIAFQDGFEKITKFTKISNCTIANRGQLLCITDKSNKGGNVGIRYINQSPNGIAKNEPTSPNPMAYGLPSFLDSDPNFITG